MASSDIILVSTREISPGERRQLVKLLLACPTMKDRESRESVLGLLNSQVSGSIRRHAADRVDVLNIATTCLNYPNGLQELVDAVYDLEGFSIPVLQLKLFLFAPQVMSRGLFEELIALVCNVDLPPKELESMYNYCKPPGWTIPQSNVPLEKLVLILQKLEQAPRQADGSAPMLKFVNYVAKHIQEQSTRDGLYDWVKRAAKCLGTSEVGFLEASDVESAHNEKSPEQAGPYLLVKIEPSFLASELFSLSAWCFSDQKGNIEELSVSEEPCKFEDVQERLDQLLEQCSDYITNPKNRLTIELFLPFYLFDYNIHQWTIDPGFGNTALLDNYYPLVVRSWDRLYRKSKGSNKKSYQAWKENWLILEDYKERHTDLKPKFLSMKDYERDDPVSFLLDVVYLALTFVPQKSLDKKQLDSPIFSAIISSGMSVALWPSGQGERLDEQEIQRAYEALLSGCELDELPQIMWKKRRNADKDDLVHRLTLLWDDPNRLPPDVVNLLRAPERKGSEQ